MANIFRKINYGSAPPLDQRRGVLLVGAYTASRKHAALLSENTPPQ